MVLAIIPAIIFSPQDNDRMVGPYYVDDKIYCYNVQSGNTTQVRDLLTCGVGPDVRDDDDMTPLHFSAEVC